MRHVGRLQTAKCVLDMPSQLACGQLVQFDVPQYVQRVTMTACACQPTGLHFAGDKLQFGSAAEKVKAEGFLVESVVIGDDCSLPGQGIAGRRGIAGALLVYKVSFLIPITQIKCEMPLVDSRRCYCETTSPPALRRVCDPSAADSQQAQLFWIHHGLCSCIASHCEYSIAVAAAAASAKNKDPKDMHQLPRNALHASENGS